MKSIVQDDDSACYICGRYGGLEEHHIFGASNRKWSTKYRLTVKLCHNCHNEPPDGIHHNKANRIKLMQTGQRAFEDLYGHKKFMEIFGRNWLEEDSNEGLN